MNKLIITEKPSVGAAYAALLGAKKRMDGYWKGNGYLVSWCLGHLVELAGTESYDERYAKWNRADLPILPDPWQMKVAHAKKKQFETLRTLLHREDVSEVINACDAGREGEAIFRYVYEMAGGRKPVKRLGLSSMEDDAVRDGFQHLRPGTEYDNLYAAALCRAKADWLVGINATRLFSTCYHRTLNVARLYAGNVFTGQLFGMNCQRHLLGLISGIEAVDQVLQRNQQAAGGAVRFKAVIPVNHRNEPHAHGREDVLQQVACLDIITGKPAEILDDKRLDFSLPNVGEQSLKLRAVRVGSGPAVVHISEDFCASVVESPATLRIFV